jgi:hypothetical protein
MLTLFYWLLGVAAYLALALALARCMAINKIRYPDDRRRRDRRRHDIPVAMERRMLLDRRGFLILASERGVTVVVVAVFIALVALPMMALALGVSQMYVERNAAQNAADAAALACAAAFYDPDAEDWPQPQNVYPAEASSAGHSIATANGHSGCDVELGHWRFTTRTFSTLPVSGDIPNFEEVTLEELEAEPAYANACRVRCDYTGTLLFLGGAFDGSAMASAAILAQEATEDRTGVELTRGGHLVQ